MVARIPGETGVHGLAFALVCVCMCRGTWGEKVGLDWTAWLQSQVIVMENIKRTNTSKQDNLLLANELRCLRMLVNLFSAWWYTPLIPALGCKGKWVSVDSRPTWSTH